MPASIPITSANRCPADPFPRCTERNVDGKRVGPRNEQADNTSGPAWPIERVASFRRIPSWPESLRLTERPHTRLQPHRLPNSDLLGHLQEESIHEKLGRNDSGNYELVVGGAMQEVFNVLRKADGCIEERLIGARTGVRYLPPSGPKP